MRRTSQTPTRRRVSSRFLATLLTLSWVVGAASAEPTFDGIGDLLGGDVDSAATAVAADGSVVAGYAFGIFGLEAIRWTAGGGIVSLGELALAEGSEATGVSGDGSVIVGVSGNGSGDRAFKWTSGGGMIAYGTLSCDGCDPSTVAFGISSDGLVAVGAGISKTPLGDPRLDATRWTGGGTGISVIGDLPGGDDFAEAMGASSNGATIVGLSDGSAGLQGFHWTSGGGIQALPGVAGAQIRSAASAISSDASTIVGFANTSPSTDTQLEAVRWSGAGFATVTVLGSLPGAASTSSEAFATTSDGALIVGRARNASNSDSAFLWDSTNGMQALADVIAAHGLDLGGWVLEEATGISDVVGGDTFTVVGKGINPSGDPEGWVAFLTTPECSNGIDDDADFDIDHPADAECWGPLDFSEEIDCADGIDNDADGAIDHPADPDCVSALDPTEKPDCSDGVDNDGDTLIDHPADPGCESPGSQDEAPACDDGIDNDVDLAIDFPADSGCTHGYDLSEVADCNDGLDNDADTRTDWPNDNQCDNFADGSELPACSDGIDNNSNGRLDYPADVPACVSADDDSEWPQCDDGEDNDGDLAIDFPSDADCDFLTSPREAPGVLNGGDLVVADRASRAVFAVDPVTGTQTLLSQDGWLSDPQAIAEGPVGYPVVADRNGVIEITTFEGAQRPVTGALVADVVSSLGIVFDGSGDAFVLDEEGIHTVAWNKDVPGVKSLFMAIPTGEPTPILGTTTGGTLAIEASGDLVTTGAAIPVSDGVYRVAVPGATATALKPGFTLDSFLDLAVEASGDILGVGEFVAGGSGVHRIDPVTGIPTAFSVGGPFVRPTGVAVAPAGDIYVADAGTCSGSCTGGRIIHVDELSGVTTVISTGGFITGEMDLYVANPVPEPGALLGIAAGALHLVVLARRRARGAGR